VIRHYVAGARISWVDCDDVAQAAAACLRDPATHDGKTYRLASDVKSFHEVAHTLTQILGQPFSYEPRPAEEFLHNALAAGADAAYMQSAYENYAAYSAGKIPAPGASSDTLAELLGRPDKTWAEFAQAHRDNFAYACA
jgi:uncharacterized protein YbjT (DUF2867 family)